MKAFVTGAAGFIGSNLVDRLLAEEHQVTGFDNFSTGLREFLAGALKHPRFQLVEGDLLDLDTVKRALGDADFVFHLAANADVRFGPDHPRRDLEQNTIATWNVLEAMRAGSARKIAFSSTGSVYGEPDIFPTPETAPFPVQTSLYGASKLAAEGLLSAYSASRLTSFASSPSWENATPTATFSISTASCCNTPAGWRSSVTAISVRATSTCRTA